MNRAARPSAPHLRHGSDTHPLPPGWHSYQVGVIAGLTMDVAYEPRRHQVLRTINTTLNPAVKARLIEQGWRQLAIADDHPELWARERTTAMRTALRRLAAVMPDVLGITR